MATMQTASGDLSRRETFGLIGSDKVEGTPVYRSNGDRIGTIERVMIDKLSGKVAYAVMSFGGFLGIGDDYYPVPWSLLTYNERLGGYEVNISDAQLKGAPKFTADEPWDYDNRAAEQSLYSYYGATPYW
ncbi:MAG TPA: PRC-barrel domain-containing protein [Rhizomicrobium sp.]